MTTCATYYGANTWLIEIAEKRILLDPWFTGDLTFPPGAWLIKGELKKRYKIPESIDLILLTQGLADHTHEKSLRLFKLNTPIIATKSAQKIVQSIGFYNITILEPNMKFNLPNMEIIATKGARVPSIENGYIIKSKNKSIYIEPHGFFDEEIEMNKVDIVISPVVNIGLPIIGPFICGKDAIKAIKNKLNPSYILASTVGGEIDFTGILSKFIKQEGTFEEAELSNSTKCVYIDPELGKKYLFK